MVSTYPGLLSLVSASTFGSDIHFPDEGIPHSPFHVCVCYTTPLQSTCLCVPAYYLTLSPAIDNQVCAMPSVVQSVTGISATFNL